MTLKGLVAQIPHWDLGRIVHVAPSLWFLWFSSFAALLGTLLAAKTCHLFGLLLGLTIGFKHNICWTGAIGYHAKGPSANIKAIHPRQLQIGYDS